MYMRVYLLLLAIFSIIFSTQARNILPEAALERALKSEARSYSHNHIKTTENKPEYTLAYSAQSGSYYVFDRSSGGYIIVSGDDRIYPLLADIPSGTFLKSELAPAAEYILETYDKEIQSVSESGMSEPDLMEYYTQWTDINPLMSTQWNQDYPYNIYCPAVGTQVCMTGCVATAMAQVIRCIGYYNGSGYRRYDGINANGEAVEYDFGANSFDFDQMYDSYSSSVSKESIDQVGRLMLACGLAAGMNYGVSESGANNTNVPNAFSKYFGYDSKYTRMFYRYDFSQAQWENMIYRQLQLGRPVYYSGSSGIVGHAFVIDGYRTAGLYHVNWGWGGMSDGFYRLSALNPSQTGIGSGTSKGYSSYQEMVTVVPPGADPGVTYNDMSGSISIVSDGVYSLYYKSNGIVFLNVSIGAAIVDSKGTIAATATFWPGQNLGSSTALRHDAYGYDFSSIPLPAGTYRIYPAYQPENEEYIIAGNLTDRQYYINLIVSETGEYNLSNISEEKQSSDIHIAGIVPGNDLHVGFSGSLSFYAVNNGSLDFDGSIKLTMLDGSGNKVVSFLSNSTSVAAGANNIIDSEFPVFDISNNLIQAGIYALQFTDNNDNMLSDKEFSIEIKTGSPLSNWNSTENINVTNHMSMPSVLIRGDLWPHTPLIETQDTHNSISLHLAFYNPSSTTAAYTYPCFKGSIWPMASMLPIDPLVIDVPFGIYEVCYRKGYSQISQRCPIRIGESIDGLYYLPLDDNEVSATMMQSDNGNKEIIIPAQVSINGTNRTVTTIEPEAFMSNASILTVEIPSSIETIGVNAFFLCSSLNQIIIHAEEPPFAFRNHIAPGLAPTTAFYVPASAYDKYKRLLEKYNPVYTLVETIESATKELTVSNSTVNLSFAPAHEAVNPDFVITPADEHSSTIAFAQIASVESGKLNIDIKGLKKGTATFHIYPAHRSDRYAVLTVKVPEQTSIENIAADNDTYWPADIYTATGILLKQNASESYLQYLPHGLYILRSPSGIRKIIR
jgi:hypothetical protein